MNYGEAARKTEINPATQPKISGSIISFVVFYRAPVDSRLAGNVLGGTGVLTTTYQARPANFSLDVKDLNRIMILRSGATPLPVGCSDARPGYLIAMKSSSTTLPNAAELTLNALDATELDQIIAALRYLAPNVPIMASGL